LIVNINHNVRPSIFYFAEYENQFSYAANVLISDTEVVCGSGVGIVVATGKERFLIFRTQLLNEHLGDKCYVASFWALFQDDEKPKRTYEKCCLASLFVYWCIQS
jgi:hypothetical protein